MDRIKLMEVLESYPEKVPQSMQSPESVYRKEAGLCAFNGVLPGELKTFHVFTLEQEQINIIRMPSTAIEIDAPLETTGITAVYAMQSSGPLFIPTGRIFIRLDTSRQPGDIAGQLAKRYYKIVEIPGYAPYSAWLEHQSGRVDRALCDMKLIQTIGDIENFEPQMLTSRLSRHSK